MSLRILNWPHPTLMRPSKPLKRVDAELHRLVREMFDLMYSDKHRGIGLAANQVDLPYRIFIANLSSDPSLKDQEHVFINPVLSKHKGSAEAEEGCLSLPGLYAPVRRPEKVMLNAYTLQGQEVQLPLDGMFARVVQHEVDHLDGVLFIDRLSETESMALREDLDDLALQFENGRRRGEIESDEVILARLTELERLRT